MLGNRIKEVRVKKKITAKELATSLEITEKTLSSYENNKRKPSYQLIEYLHEKLNVNTNWLLTGNGEMFIGESNEVTKKINGNNNNVAIGSHNKQNSDNSLLSVVDDLTKHVIEDFQMLDKKNQKAIHLEILTKLREEGKI